jgi:Arc/MetJ-type ribon-helix-helix transcriptional regulator
VHEQEHILRLGKRGGAGRSAVLEKREASLQALRAALIEGESSGASEAVDFDAFIAEKRKRAAAK